MLYDYWFSNLLLDLFLLDLLDSGGLIKQVDFFIFLDWDFLFLDWDFVFLDWDFLLLDWDFVFLDWDFLLLDWDFFFR